MKQITCITCPIGCRVSIEVIDKHYTCTGNQCKRGGEFAKTELVSPVRSLTTTVRTSFPDVPVLPVRTNGEVPKEKITEIMHELSKVIITERIGIGEIVVDNVLGTGIDVIATQVVVSD